MVELTRDGYRLLGADGTVGWTTSTAPAIASGVAFDTPEVEVSSAVFKPDSASAGVKTSAIGADFASIVGASRGPVEEEMWQLGAGSWLDDVAVPWLQVKSVATSGWLYPSSTNVVWNVTEAERCNPYAGLHGLVRAPFLTRAKRELLSLLPHAGTALSPVLADSDSPWKAPKAGCSVEAAIFLEESQPPTLVVFNCENTQVFSYSALGKRTNFLLSYDRAHLARFQLADVQGDAEPELLLEVGMKSGHDYVTTLVMLPSQPGEKLLGAFALNGLAAETRANWAVDVKAREVSLVRTTKQAIDVKRVRALSAGSSPGDWALVEEEAYLAVLGQPKALVAAERDALAHTHGLVVPLPSKAKPSFAVGEVFSTQAIACGALDAPTVSAGVRALSANRACQALARKK